MKKILFLILVLLGMAGCQQPIDSVQVITSQTLILSGVPTVSGHFTVVGDRPAQGVVIIGIAYKAGVEVARARATVEGTKLNNTPYAFTLPFSTLSSLADLDEYTVTASEK